MNPSETCQNVWHLLDSVLYKPIGNLQTKTCASKAVASEEHGLVLKFSPVKGRAAMRIGLARLAGVV